jgi:uncharacterized protein DUF4157
VATSASSLPHGDTIQRLFGRHDISAVQAHTGPDAAASAQAMGAQAYATGNHVVLGNGGSDLHTVAHEAAHVVQQRGGVQLKGGVGEVGDSYERHADEVADLVVQGKSAEALLDRHAGAEQTAQAGGVQRVETRGTEAGILNDMGPGGSLTDANSAALIAKMDKDQSAARARAIAAEIETESEQLVAALPADQQTAVRAAIRDYVSSSTAIQNDARDATTGPSVAVVALDAALVAIRQQITVNAASNPDANDRIVYRSISYGASTEIPYGQANTAGDIVNVGDLVGDLGFVSTSAHRQFVSGKEQTAQVTAMLKLAIHGNSGAPIAIHFPVISYTNANQKLLFEMMQNSKNKLSQVLTNAFGAGPGAGQAEVLFPRNTVFRVTKIERKDPNVSVVLEEEAAPTGGMKNMKTGAAM